MGPLWSKVIESIIRKPPEVYQPVLTIRSWEDEARWLRLVQKMQDEEAARASGTVDLYWPSRPFRRCSYCGGPEPEGRTCGGCGAPRGQG